MNHGLACSIELEFAPGKLQDHKEFLNVTMKNKQIFWCSSNFPCKCIHDLMLHAKPSGRNLRIGFTGYSLQAHNRFGRPTKITGGKIIKKIDIYTISKFPESLFSPNSILALNYNSFCSSVRVGLADPSDVDFGAGRRPYLLHCKLLCGPNVVSTQRGAQDRGHRERFVSTVIIRYNDIQYN